MSEIQVNTINEYTGASGVTIDGVLIKDGQVDGVDVSTLSVDTNNLVKLQTATASNSLELLFDNFVDTSTYSHYIVSIQDLLPVNNGVVLRFTFRENGASGSDKAGAYAYAYAYNYLDTTSVGETRGTDTDFGRISGNVGNTAGSLHALQIEQQFFSGNGTNSGAYLRTPHTTRQANGSVAGFYQWAVTIENLFTCTGLKYYFSSGNIASGTITIFGVKK